MYVPPHLKPHLEALTPKSLHKIGSATGTANQYFWVLSQHCWHIVYFWFDIFATDKGHSIKESYFVTGRYQRWAEIGIGCDSHHVSYQNWFSTWPVKQQYHIWYWISYDIQYSMWYCGPHSMGPILWGTLIVALSYYDSYYILNIIHTNIL